MIPTPAKRRHQQQEFTDRDMEPEDEEDELEQRSSIFNNIIHEHHIVCGHHELDESSQQQQLDELDELGADEDEDDEDELDYLRLDTIVEEEEDENWDLADQSAGNNNKHDDRRRLQSLPICDSERQTTAKDNNKSATNNSINKPPVAPPAEMCNLANSMRKFSDSSRHQQQQQTSTNSIDKSETSSQTGAIIKQQGKKMQHQHQQQFQPIPSTNRLISEHQVRQQQTLFRALAERQKMMDELGADQRVDLMSAGSLASLRAKANAQQSAHKRRSRSKSADRSLDASRDAIPLSAVDLSSMSDRMLDELLGQIASASSSSLSSNGESIDSSEPSSDDDDQDDHRLGQHPTELHASRDDRLSILNDLPNVIGVHEDERTRAQNGSRQLNCRDAHKRSCDNGNDQDDDDDDDDNKDHELLLQLGLAGANEPSESLSPSALAEQRQFGQVHEQTRNGSKSELYLAEQSQLNGGQSVEDVLLRMLDALNECGLDQQEHLNELLERGFAHLEQLLNCNLATNQHQQQHHQQIPHPQPSRSQASCLAHKLISNQQQQQQSNTTLSKDSDYGSDTQSADCFSQFNEPLEQQAVSNKWLAMSQRVQESRESPSPSSLTTNSTQNSHSSSSNNSSRSAPAGSSLSPLAVELSFKLAECLHRLAQQQSARREQPASGQPSSSADKKKTPMKSVVTLNANRSPSASSVVSSCSIDLQQQQQQRNLTPVSVSDQAQSVGQDSEREMCTTIGSGSLNEQQPRLQYKTCVSIGGSKSPEEQQQQQQVEGEVQVVKVSASGQSQVGSSVIQIERRRASRCSLRRRSSFTGSTNSSKESGANRPGSPLPRPMADEQHQQHQQHQQHHQEQNPKTSKSMKSQAKKPTEQQQQQQSERQLQRALILAQKYNYSPAKLAASKLSHKLRFKDLTDSAANNNNQVNGSQTLKYSSQQEDLEPNKRQLKHKLEFEQHQNQPIGQLQLDISYFAKSGSLTVHVLQCNTQLANASKRRNPYVKLYLLPDRSKSGKRKSRIHRSEQQPNFDQKFTFGPLQLSEFADRILWLSVWHKDRPLRNELLGELLLPLSQVRQQLLSSDLCQSTGAKYYQLNARAQQAQSDCQELQTGDKAMQVANGGASNGQQMEARSRLSGELSVDRLAELQRKAARLASAVAPTTDFQDADSTQAMSASLGPPVELTANQPPISGQLFVALKFVPDNNQLVSSRNPNVSGELQVWIKEAHNIAGFECPLLTSLDSDASRPNLPAGSLPNPLAKCYLLASNGHRIGKQKTPHLKRTANPSWDHKCIFECVKLSQLSCQAIEIQVFNRDSYLVRNEYLGGIRLCQNGPTRQFSCRSNSTSKSDDQATAITAKGVEASDDSSSRLSLGEDLDESALCGKRESRLWTQMLVRPNIWVYGELKLSHLRPLKAG